MNIIKKLIKYNFYTKTNTPIYIVIHDTGNPSVGANAEMHYRYFNGGNRQASAHFMVDDREILQLINIEDSAWHVGDGGNRYGINNKNSIGIEICINKDGNYELAVKNTIDLVIHLMKEYNIPIANVVRHFDASRKICPNTMSGNSWQPWYAFKTAIINKLNKKPITNLNEALGVLMKHEIINSPRYWRNVARVIKYVKELILNMANKLNELER